jgi:4-methylaminobutanoate oxidase (formaldehyde-forming)
LEAGLAFACAWNKPGGFVGREALLRQRDAGLPTRRLVQFLLEDATPMLYHNEPIYRDGVRNSYTTSAMFGHTLGACVAMGYVLNAEGVSDEWLNAGRYEIEVGNERYPARMSIAPLYDPEFQRIRG